MPREFYKPVKNLVISFTYIQLFAYISFSEKQSMLVVVGLLKYNSPSFMDQVTGELMVITRFF